MRFPPKTEKEVSGTLEAGEYDFKVRTAEERTSQSSGNEMIALLIEVYGQGKAVVVKDYLLGVEAMAYKLRHFCYAVGLGSVYEDGELTAEDCVGRGGRLRLAVEKGDDKYPDKNTVRDYCMADSTKKTEGYQDAKANGNGLHAAPVSEAAQAERAAKKAFASIHRDQPQDEIRAAWEAAMKLYFRGAKVITAAEWMRFIKDKFEPAAVTSPISDNPQFAEDDIPFAAPHR